VSASEVAGDERVIVCGRSSGLAKAVVALRGAGRADSVSVTLVTEDDLEVDRCALIDADRVCGNPTSTEVLEHAGVRGALAVLVVREDAFGGGGARIEPSDEFALRVTLAARSLDPEVPILVEAVETRSRHLLESAGATTVVSAETVSARALAQSILDPGVSHVYEHLLGSGVRGMGIYAVSHGGRLTKAEFGTLELAVTSKGGCVVGWREADGTLSVNPNVGARVPDNAALLLVAADERAAIDILGTIVLS